MLRFLLQSTPVPTETVTDAAIGSWWNNLDTGDWLALSAIVVSVLTVVGTFLFDRKVHNDQMDWQNGQETQRQTERKEDLARLAEDAKIKLVIKLGHAHYFPTGHGPGCNEVAALAIEVVNTGKLEARLTRARITLPNGQQALIQPMTVGIEDEVTSFPCSLPANRAATINAAMLEMVATLKEHSFADSIEITATVDDALGAVFPSNIYSLDLNRDW